MIVNYFSAGLLGPLVASLAAQTRPPVEVVVVDNGDDYPLDAAALAAAAASVEVRVVAAGRNLGYGPGANLGVASLTSDADLVALVNPDVELVSPDLLASLAEVAARPGVGLVSPHLDSAKYRWAASLRFPTAATLAANMASRRLGDGQVERFARFVGHVPAGDRRPRFVAHTNGAFQVVDRAAFVAVGGFDERYFFYAEELDLCWRLARAGWRRAYLPDVSARHAGGASSARHGAARDLDLYLEAMERYFADRPMPVSRAVFSAARRWRRRG